MTRCVSRVHAWRADVEVSCWPGVRALVSASVCSWAQMVWLVVGARGERGVEWRGLEIPFEVCGFGIV